MAKTIIVGQFQYDVYDTNMSSVQSRLGSLTGAFRDFTDTFYDGQSYLIFTGPEYMFSRKNYTMSAFNTPEFIASNVDLARDEETAMEESLAVRVKVGYTEIEKKEIVSSLKNLTVGQPRTLFLPGTILWREYLYLKKLLKRVAKMYNTLPIISNGNVVHTYNKKRDSDEIKADYRLRVDRLADAKYHNYQDRRYRFEPGVSANVFDLWGMSFGVEICADHAGGVLKNGLDKGQKIDVQFLISAGMKPTKNGVGLKDGGLMINNDGSASDKAQGVATWSAGTGTFTDCAERAGRGATRIWRATID